MTIPLFVRSRRPWLCLAAWMTMNAPAAATATVTCDINDKFVTLEMQAIAGRSGPIQQVHVGAIAIKPAAGRLASPQMTFDRTHIVQQWILGSDLRLQIEVTDAAAKETVNLIISARLDSKRETYRGGYLLKIARGGKPTQFKGRIKECVAG